MKGCGLCHECGHILLSQRVGEDGLDGEWCPDCAEVWRYWTHGFSLRVRQESTLAAKRRRSQCGIKMRECEHCAPFLRQPEPQQSQPQQAEFWDPLWLAE